MKEVKEKAPEVRVPVHVVKVGGVIFEHYRDRVVAQACSDRLEVRESPNSCGRVEFSPYPSGPVQIQPAGRSEAKETDLPEGCGVCTPEDLMNYIRQALRYYRFWGEFRVPREWAQECEEALAIIAFRLGCIDEDVAREVYGLRKDAKDAPVDGIDTVVASV